MKYQSPVVAALLGLASANPVIHKRQFPQEHSHERIVVNTNSKRQFPQEHSHERLVVHAMQKREVPQEQSHLVYLQIVKEFLDLNNPLGIVDPVFGLLGNAAAADGVAADINLDCLKQFTADQAFTNAKEIGDVRGMAGALVYQALERNTGGVGVKSVICPEDAVNPEIAAFDQHQDPASEGATELNTAITLELAKQLALIGVDPLVALESGTFAPGDVNDPTGAGNSCDTADDLPGCIFTQRLLVLDASPDEVLAAVADITPTFTGTGVIEATNIDFVGLPLATGGVFEGSDAVATQTAADTAAATDTATATVNPCTAGIPAATGGAKAGKNRGNGRSRGNGRTRLQVGAPRGRGRTGAAKNKGNNNTGAAQTAVATAAETAAAASQVCSVVTRTIPNCAAKSTAAASIAADAAATESATSAGVNIQSFTGTLGGAPPPVISSAGDRPFSVNGNTFTGQQAALSRSCDIQHNACANAANSGQLAGGTAQCEQQLQECKAQNNLRRKRQAAALDFGSCTDPTIKFGVGFDGRREASFAPSNNADFNHGSAQRIGIISSFICQRLGSSCKASAATVAACEDASTQALAATQDQTAADLFNSLLTGAAAGAGAGAGGAASEEEAATATATQADSATAASNFVVVTVTQCA